MLNKLFSLLACVLLICSCHLKDGPDDTPVPPSLHVSFVDADGNDLLSKMYIGDKSTGIISNWHRINYEFNGEEITLPQNPGILYYHQLSMFRPLEQEKYYCLSLFSLSSFTYVCTMSKEEGQVFQITAKLEFPELFGDDEVHRLQGTWVFTSNEFIRRGGVTLDGKELKESDSDYYIAVLDK